MFQDKTNRKLNLIVNSVKEFDDKLQKLDETLAAILQQQSKLNEMLDTLNNKQKE